MRRPLLSTVVLAAASLAAATSPGCAPSRGGGRAGPLDPSSPVPADFRLVVDAREGMNPHCDYRLEFSADGTVEYEVRHRAPRAADRRGRVVLPPDRIATVWRWTARCDLPGLPSRLGPEPGHGERGVLAFSFRGAGRSAEVILERASHAGLDSLLRAVFWAVPVEVFRVPG